MFKASENNALSFMGVICFAFFRNVRLFHVGKGVVVVIVNITKNQGVIAPFNRLF